MRKGKQYGSQQKLACSFLNAFNLICTILDFFCLQLTFLSNEFVTLKIHWYSCSWTQVDGCWIRQGRSALLAY